MPVTPPTGPITLLGPQTDFAQVADALDELGIKGRVALITAGWQENECEDEGLSARLGLQTTNLLLHRRSEEVFATEPDFSSGWATKQKHLQHLQEFYRIRIDAVDDAASAIGVRHVDPALIEEQLEITVSQLKHLDDDHLQRCCIVLDAFNATWETTARPIVMDHRESIAAEIRDCDALVIAGGHVVALLNRMRLFDVFAAVEDRPIVAWSAGAMTLTDRVILFHDSPPFGKNLAQILDRGMGFCPGVVVLPDMSRRVRLDQASGIARFARRMAPAACLSLDPGDRLRFEGGRLVDAQGSVHLSQSGIVEQEWTL
jgi:hypothetical protein